MASCAKGFRKKKGQLEQIDSDTILTEEEEKSVKKEAASARDTQLVEEAVDEAEEEEAINEEDEEDETTSEEEDAEEEEEAVEEPFSISATANVRKYGFKLKQSETGNILTIHHTVREENKLIRIRLGACCFSEGGTQFVAIDKRGHIFVFDFAQKQYWRLAELVQKACVVRAYQQRTNIFLIGTKMGQLFKIDIAKSCLVGGVIVAPNAPITEISFVGQPLKPPHLALVRAGDEALLVNVDTLCGTHRLKFDDVQFSLKFASYLPLSELIFTCFTNDSLQVWSSVTLNTLRVLYPIKVRDRRVQLAGGVDCLPQVSLCPPEPGDELQLSCLDKDYANGLILAYCYSQELNLLCLATLDNYLILLSRHTFEVQSILRLRDFVLQQCAFLPKAKETLILGLTTRGRVILIDCNNTDSKLIIQPECACSFSLAADGKLLAVVMASGEAHIWSTCRIYNTLRSQEQCLAMLKAAFKRGKPLAVTATNDSFNEDIKKLLKRDRMLSILKEYGCYPAKYRTLIWCAMLQVPSNRREFQRLLKLTVPAPVKQRAQRVKLKNETMWRTLVKIWSCLAHWCKVFAYCDFLPYLIFPFVKLYPKNALTAFEVCATLLLNHFQLWFELHPLAPANYLGMCDNVLQHFDPELCKFYASLDMHSQDYAWTMLANAFSEVFDQEQWLCLWDNIVSAPLHFPIFIVVAYNILQREVIIRLPDKDTIRHFFREQNPVDVTELIAKALTLMAKCPCNVHPERYIGDFQAIPKNVYPKFLKYPREWLQQHEDDVMALQREQQAIDSRLRQLELAEHHMMERLENGLKQEEHAKRLKDMEQLYQNILKREEERIACQRKMLMLYQREIRTRKGEVIEKLQESEQRKKAFEMARQLESLIHNVECERVRNETDLVMAEDEVRTQELNLLEQKYLGASEGESLDCKYRDDVLRVCRERDLLRDELREMSSDDPKDNNNAAGQQTKLDNIERELCDIQKEFFCLTREGKGAATN